MGRGADKLKVFIATLGWSQAANVEFCDDERVETLIQAHEPSGTGKTHLAIALGLIAAHKG